MEKLSFTLNDKGYIVLTDEIWDFMQQVNVAINQKIHYKTDLELYQKPDFWTVAESQGDCDDYSITKRKLLRDNGFPKSCVCLATCWVEGNDGPGTGGYHAVLVVKTDRGSFVLDNRHGQIMYFKDLPYKWHLLEVPETKFWKEVEN